MKVLALGLLGICAGTAVGKTVVWYPMEGAAGARAETASRKMSCARFTRKGRPFAFGWVSVDVTLPVLVAERTGLKFVREDAGPSSRAH